MVYSTLEASQGQILSQSPTDAIEFVWKLSKETIILPLGCLQGGNQARLLCADDDLSGQGGYRGQLGGSRRLGRKAGRTAVGSQPQPRNLRLIPRVSQL